MSVCCPGESFAVEDVARAAGEERNVWDLEDALWDLVDRSWLQDCTDADGELRFRFRRLVRQYVVERCRGAGERGE